MFCTAFSPNLKTPATTFVNAHTVSHYLQTSVLSLNRTLSIECCSEISINLVYQVPCYFTSIFHSVGYVCYIINFYFFLLHFILCRICHMFNKVLTYLLGVVMFRRGRPFKYPRPVTQTPNTTTTTTVTTAAAAPVQQ